MRAERIIADVPIDDTQIQPASIDLRLGPIAYRVQASFLPGRFATVMDRVKALHMADLDLSGNAVLEKGCIYIVPLLEQLDLPQDTSARANPKSTTGRLDVFTRLITELYALNFEFVPAGYTLAGYMWRLCPARLASDTWCQGDQIKPAPVYSGVSPVSAG